MDEAAGVSGDPPGLERWQRELSSPLDRLSAMFDLSKLSDLTITFPSDKLSLKVHRLILAMSSPVFEAMLFGPMAAEGDLSLPDDSPEAFIFLMNYIYKGCSTFPDIATAVQVYYLANKYEIMDLCSICSKFLQEKLDETTLPLIYDMAVLVDDKILLEQCKQIMEDPTKNVMSSSHIGNLSSQSLKDYIQHTSTILSETIIFKGILEWGKFQLRKKSNSEDNYLRQEVEEFLPLVRFLSMTTGEFVKNVLPLNVLKNEEAIDILMSIEGVGNTPLPKICSHKRKRRIDVAELYKVRLKRGTFDYIPLPIQEKEVETEGNFVEEIDQTINFRSDTYESLYTPKCKVVYCNLLYDFRCDMDILIGGFEFILDSRFCNTDVFKVSVINSSDDTIAASNKCKIMSETVCDQDFKKLCSPFQVPLQMTKNENYVVRLHCCKQSISSYHNSFTVNLCEMKMSGVLYYAIEAFVYFWCFDRGFKSKKVKLSCD